MLNHEPSPYAELLPRRARGEDLPGRQDVDATADRVITEFTPESERLYRDTTSARDLPDIRAYVHTTQGKQLPAAVQRRSVEALRATWTEDLSTGHLPMLLDPLAVNQAVRKLLAHVDG